MIPFIIAGVVVAAGAGAAYKYFTKNDEPKKPSNSQPQPTTKTLGTFVIWGRPNVGKTTFIARLRGETPSPEAKTATTAKTIYTNIPLGRVIGKPVVIEKIIDMPGTEDRLNDWLEMATQKKNHVFYMVDLSRITQKNYAAAISKDLTATVKAMNNLAEKERKRIHILCTHVDESDWKDLQDDADVGNKIQSDENIRYIYESLDENGVAGYFYYANLTNNASFQRLIQSIVNDCNA